MLKEFFFLVISPGTYAYTGGFCRAFITVMCLSLDGKSNCSYWTPSANTQVALRAIHQ